MELEPVRDAYASVSEDYIALFGGDQPAGPEASFIRRHLTGLAGPVLDLGCGPGRWTAYLSSLGADVTGVDLVPEFIDHARATFPGLTFRLGSMTDVDARPGSVAGILSWYSTIHLAPAELDGVLTGFRPLLAPSGVLVVGFFDGHDDVTPFDHAVTTAYRWPLDVLAERVATAGFTVVEQERLPSGSPDRRYAAIAAAAP